MENTFTYTARSALAPAKVVTFTLYDDHMSVDLGAPLEHVQRAVEAAAEAGEQHEPEAEPGAPEEPEAGSDALGGASSTYALKPTAVSLLEKGARPFSIADVYAQAEDGGLAVTTWVRAKGMRLAPIRFAWEEVDNPEGAEAFADQVRARRQTASHPGRFRGLMDYWISWLVVGVLAIVLFWPRGGHEERDNGKTEEA